MAMRSTGNFKFAPTSRIAGDIQLSSRDQQAYSGQLSSATPDRFYRLRLTQRSSLKASLTGTNTNVDLALLNGQGKTLKLAAGQASESISRSLPKGTYYIRVSGQQSNTSYQLKLVTNDTRQGGQLGKPAGGTRSFSDAANNSAFVQRVVELTNLQRSQAGLAPLTLNEKLSKAAYVHSRDMALKDYFSHTGSDGSNASDRVRRAGYRYLNAGENIAAGYATPEEAVQGWMNSPGHRANILFPNVTEIGVGFYALSNDSGKAPFQYYWTQDFATPAR
jgi:uncharacterized protein YkwD